MVPEELQETIPRTVVDLGVLEESSSHVPCSQDCRLWRLVGLNPIVLSPLNCDLEQVT